MSGGVANIGTALGRGRPPVPTALKRRRGAAGPDAAEPRVAAGKVPPAPRNLGREERLAWVELRQLVNPLRVATQADLPAFTLLVEAMGVALRAAEVIRREGLTMIETGLKGQRYVRTRPEVGVLANFQKIVWYGLGRFGLTPADRARVVSLTGIPVNDPADEFAGD